MSSISITSAFSLSPVKLAENNVNVTYSSMFCNLSFPYSRCTLECYLMPCGDLNVHSTSDTFMIDLIRK